MPMPFTVLSACPLPVQAEHAQAELSGQLRQAQRMLQEAEGKLQASQESLTFVAAEKKALSQHCSKLEHRLNRLQQVFGLPTPLPLTNRTVAMQYACSVHASAEPRKDGPRGMQSGRKQYRT